MNKKKSRILLISIGIAIFGFLIDDDVKEPSTIMRFVEFFAMTGIVFIILFSMDRFLGFIKKRINLLRS